MGSNSRGSFLDRQDESFLNRKHGNGAHGRRHKKAAQYEKTMRDTDVVIKTTNSGSMSTSRKNRSLLEPNTNCDTNVIYSMNKRNRWEETPSRLLHAVNTSDNTIVAERRLMMHGGFFGDLACSENNVVAVHSKNEGGDVETRTVSGRGVKLELLTEDKNPETVINFVSANHGVPFGPMKRYTARHLTKSRPVNVLLAEEDLDYDLVMPREYGFEDSSDLQIEENAEIMENSEDAGAPSQFRVTLDDLMVERPTSSKRDLQGWERMDKEELPEQVVSLAYKGAVKNDSTNSASLVADDSHDQMKPGVITPIPNDISAASEKPNRMIYFELPVKAMAWWSVFQQQLIDFNNANKETSLLLNLQKTLLYIDLTSRISYLANEKRIPKAVLIVHLVTTETVRFFLNASVKLREPKCVRAAVNTWNRYRPAVYDTPVNALTANELTDRLWDQRLTLAKAVEMIVKLFDDYVVDPRDLIDATNYKLSSHSMALSSMATSVSFAEALNLITASQQHEPSSQWKSSDENTCCECRLAADPLFNTTEGAACGVCLRRQVVHDIERLLPVRISFDGIAPGMNHYVVLQVLPLPLWIEMIEATVKTRHSSKQSTRCIECESLLFFDKNAFGNVICPKCRVVFCVECEHQPHWPFACEDAYMCEGPMKGVKGMTMPENLSKICMEAQSLRNSLNYRLVINRMLIMFFTKEDEDREMYDITKTALYLSQQVLAYSFYQRFMSSSFKTIKQTAIEVIDIVKKLRKMDTIHEFYRAKKILQRSSDTLMSFCR